ncbi:Tol-Pal system beta propeller repeat protein TolB [bacterium]|nr:MAG: Tol-Pal system beta propeller repeat protein TolB [bacterium]
MSRAPLALALLLAALPAGASEVYIGLEGAAGKAWTLGLDSFTSQDPKSPADAADARALRDVLRSDLLFSRSFVLADQPPAADSPDVPAAWRAKGASFLIRAVAGRNGDMLAFQLTLTDLGSGQPLLSRYYRQKAEFLRVLAHTAADDVVRQLTGRRGVARSRLAFVNDQSGAKEIYVADYDGAELKKVTSNRSLNLLPRWRPDGRALAFTSYKENNPDLYLYDFEKGKLSTLSERQGLNIAGGFSPDGTQLALTLSRGKEPNIFLLSLKDLSAKQLTNHFGVDSSATFSPDGLQVAFVSDRAGNPQVHVMELATGKIKRLTGLNWCDSPSWSPTGEWIAFAGRANRKDNMDIFLVDVTGTRVVQLTHGEGQNEAPSWAPDGRFLAFSSTRRGGKPQVYLMDADGSAPRQWLDLPGGSYSPHWSP